MHICQESLPILKPMNSLLGFWLDFPLFALLAQKYSPPQTLNRLACSLLQPVLPELQFLCYSQINSISGHLSLPWFTSLSRLPGKQDYQDSITCLRGKFFPVDGLYRKRFSTLLTENVVIQSLRYAL